MPAVVRTFVRSENFATVVSAYQDDSFSFICGFRVTATLEESPLAGTVMRMNPATSPPSQRVATDSRAVPFFVNGILNLTSLGESPRSASPHERLHSDAICRGVSPSLSWQKTSAPWWRRNLTNSTSSSSTASGVLAQMPVVSILTSQSLTWRFSDGCSQRCVSSVISLDIPAASIMSFEISVHPSLIAKMQVHAESKSHRFIQLVVLAPSTRPVAVALPKKLSPSRDCEWW